MGSKKKVAIMSILGYLLTMMIGVLIGNLVTRVLGSNVMGTMQVNSSNMIYKIVIQIPSTAFIIHIMNKYYKLDEIGLSLNIKITKVIWIVPYIIILFLMGQEFVNEFQKNISYYSISTYILVIITFIGTAMAGFSEEIIFRGIILNSFKSDKSILGAMIISSIGFSIVHMSIVFMGQPLLTSLSTVFYSSLLGFAFVGLAMIMKNIWFLIIFHILWNFIIIVSETLQLQLSYASGICNVLNLFMAFISWFFVFIKHKNKSKKYKKSKVS